ncbi:MAG: cobalamin B12-binding domain-containing protein [Chloroflexi bacterium]|nr:cobalamin B12-binding domain-containing protein [Chloroflexota bacterium]
MIGFLHPRSTRSILIEFVQTTADGGVIAGITDGRKIRVLIAKPGLDGHDRGAKVVARALRDAGMEVIYTGIRQSPEMIAEAALQEDVDAVGLSILSGAHMELCPRVLGLLKEKGIDDVPVFLGGIVPTEDIAKLKEIGVKGVFGPGTPTGEIIEFVRSIVPAERGE